MRTVVSACLMIAMFACLAFAQKQKPWTEWTKKDVDKTLNDSAWGQTQTEGGGGATQSADSAVTQVAAPRSSDRQLSARQGESGEAKPVAYVKYHVRFLSAKPVRAAFARTCPHHSLLDWRLAWNISNRSTGNATSSARSIPGARYRRSIATAGRC